MWVINEALELQSSVFRLLVHLIDPLSFSLSHFLSTFLTLSLTLVASLCLPPLPPSLAGWAVRGYV